MCFLRYTGHNFSEVLLSNDLETNDLAHVQIKKHYFSQINIWQHAGRETRNQRKTFAVLWSWCWHCCQSISVPLWESPNTAFDSELDSKSSKAAAESSIEVTNLALAAKKRSQWQTRQCWEGVRVRETQAGGGIKEIPGGTTEKDFALAGVFDSVLKHSPQQWY